MKPFLFSILFLALAPFAARAQQAPLREGDSLEIRLSGVLDPAEASAFNGVFPVDGKGMVNLPYIDQVPVAGLQPNEAQIKIQKMLIDKKIYTHPTITITTTSQPRLVNMIGELNTPNRIAYTPDMTLQSAIAACGGFNPYANKKVIRLTHDGKTTIHNYFEIQKDKSLDPKVFPGDTIEVKQSPF